MMFIAQVANLELDGRRERALREGELARTTREAARREAAAALEDRLAAARALDDLAAERRRHANAEALSFLQRLKAEGVALTPLLCGPAPAGEPIAAACRDGVAFQVAAAAAGGDVVPRASGPWLAEASDT
jgi:hypothetical protein